MYHGGMKNILMLLGIVKLEKLRKTLTLDNLIEYQRKKAMARKVVKDTKKEAWRQCCSTIGRETNLDKMWKMLPFVFHTHHMLC